MQFYHDIITQKSFAYLQDFKKKHDFILIGGWAVYLYTRALKSKDIDIVVEYSDLAKIKEDHDVFKNERLKKYEIKTGEFDIDIYLEHYSNLGIDAGEIKKSARIKQGFLVPALEILFLLKLFAWENRRGSAKGQKDEIDILSLSVLPEFDWKEYKKLVKDFRFESRNDLFLALLKRTRSAKETGINEQRMSKFKKEIFKQLGF